MGQYDDIAKLADLKEKGLLTEQEFETQKQKILSRDLYKDNRTNTKQPNSFTFKAVVFFVLGLIVPLWPISLPFLWYLAYKSYKSGE
ncbi:MAG: SHOCT domain-containing protein [Deltaproteobacteria bacterium]|nr:SHOCT domain-containing protein [Deltaproteobacteria bacterium]